MDVVQTIASQIKPYIFFKHQLIRVNDNTLKVYVDQRTKRMINICYVASPDSYNVEEGYITKSLEYKVVSEREDVYVEELISIIKAYS